jgi:hypothetical protein
MIVEGNQEEMMKIKFRVDMHLLKPAAKIGNLMVKTPF